MSSAPSCSWGQHTRHHAACAARPTRRAAQQAGGWRHAGAAVTPLAAVHPSSARGGEQSTGVASPDDLSRRRLLTWSAAAAALGVTGGSGEGVAASAGRPPAGYELYRDTLDGYSFFYPADWLQVKSAGADVFFRAPLQGDRNVFVEASTPSSTVKFATVSDWAPTPAAAADKLVAQYLGEFASTRLGVRREGSVVGAASRVGEDGVAYVDTTIQVSSYSVDQQYGVTVEERGPQKLEWCRLLQTTLGCANGRLYAMRLQCAKDDLAACQPVFSTMQQSFRVFDTV